MDYSSRTENDLSGWSTCSVEAFTAEMNKNKTCLRNVDPKNPPPFPSKPAVTSQVLNQGFHCWIVIKCFFIT